MQQPQFHEAAAQLRRCTVLPRGQDFLQGSVDINHFKWCAAAAASEGCSFHLPRTSFSLLEEEVFCCCKKLY